MSWQEEVVAHLCDSKRAGYGFDDAWLQAMTLFPPRGRDCGPERPSLLPDPDEAEPVVVFFRRVAADAWFGRRPALQHFHPSLLIQRDDSTPAGRSRRLAA